jgi:hypothetical protein
LYSPGTSGVHPLYTTRRADPPPDPEELTRAVPATTTAPHANRKQRIPPGKSPGVGSGRFLAALESVRRVSRCEAWAGRVEIQALGFVAAASTFAAGLLDGSPGSGLGGTIARAVAREARTDNSLIVLPTQRLLRMSSVAVSTKGIGWSGGALGSASP